MQRATLTASAIVLVISAVHIAPLTAQDVESMCAAVSEVTVGQWAEYQTTADGKQYAMRTAIVGTEQIGDTALYWYEFKAQVDGKQMIMQSLVPHFPYDPNGIRALVMKMDDQPAMKMPAEMLRMMGNRMAPNPALERARHCGGATVVGWEEIEVPAGKLRSLHMTVEGGDVWVSSDVPFGLVRAAGEHGEMVLIAHGGDATSSITETPQEMPGMRRP